MATAQLTLLLSVLPMKIYRLKTKTIVETFRNKSKRLGGLLWPLRGQRSPGSPGEAWLRAQVGRSRKTGDQALGRRDKAGSHVFFHPDTPCGLLRARSVLQLGLCCSVVEHRCMNQEVTV